MAVLYANLLLSSQLLLLQIDPPLALPSNPQGNVEVKSPSRPRLKIFHPPSNSCIFRQKYEDRLTLAPCIKCDSWKYTPQKFLTIAGTYYCLQASGPSLPAKLSISCQVSDSQWDIESDSLTSRFSTKLADGTVVCLDVGEDNSIVTNPCKDKEAAEGDSQNFQLTAVSPEIGCERECSRGEDYRLIKLSIMDFSTKKEEFAVVECRGHDAARFQTIEHAHGWEEDVVGMVEQKHGKQKISISFDCGILKADDAAQQHLRKYLPNLVGVDAVVNIGKMSISGINFDGDSATIEDEVAP